MSNTAKWPLAMSGTKACQTISGLVKTRGHLIMLRHAIGWNLRVCLLWLTGVESSIKRYFRQRRSGRHACIRSFQRWTGAAASHGQRAASEGEVVAARGAVGEVSSRAAQAQAPASAIAATRTITRRHASSSSTMSRMPQKGSSQVNVPQQSQVPRRANVRGRGRRGRDFRHLSHKHSSEGKQSAMVNNNGDRPSSCKNGNWHRFRKKPQWQGHLEAELSQEETERDTCQAHDVQWNSVIARADGPGTFSRYCRVLVIPKWRIYQGKQREIILAPAPSMCS